MLTFSSLDLSNRLLEALGEEGYETPTPIQAQAIPPVLDGRDLLGCAQTGTGKTAAFALPILDRLHRAGRDKTRRGGSLPRALILSPTRELATQIAESFQTYGRHTGLRGAVIFGGVSQYHQVKSLRRGIDILVATPGRLLDLMEQGYIDLSCIETFVLDEADRMLDMGFIQPIRQITAELPEERQTLLFSATMPREIKHLADSLLRDPIRVTVTPVASAAPKITQQLVMVEQKEKPQVLEALLAEPGVTRALVFTRTKHGADKLTRKLTRSGVSAESIHGNKSQSQRQRALESFRSGHARVLVATDVAARGIDVDGISHVINYNLPNEPEAYIHRIGRTGRAGASGIAISLCASDERPYLRAIERLLGARVGDERSSNENTPPREESAGESRPRRQSGQRSSDQSRSGDRPRSGGNQRSGGAPAQRRRRQRAGGQPAGSGGSSPRRNSRGPKRSAGKSGVPGGGVRKRRS